MNLTRTANDLGILLRIGRELDVVGDVTSVVENPSELLAWATTLSRPALLCWRTTDSGRRYLQVSARHDRAPIRGQVTAVLSCDQHLDFWDQIPETKELAPGEKASVSLAHLAHAWEVVPSTPPSDEEPVDGIREERDGCVSASP
ncbi:hypothetical protein ncot_00470 [Nocardioides sp. JQ2195]|uniref:hypothetical protein n=1 Tax=Nocardioides sp. JQ2195 TaxID=2592334 RepID=UPI00143EDA32|nr:hypothetical protein [Nocardioides sp. JQ2195]QIX25225.1 hypothetical protein ncot_00470 [Nocardioides sp. JQ2195]